MSSMEHRQQQQQQGRPQGQRGVQPGAPCTHSGDSSTSSRSTSTSSTSSYQWVVHAEQGQETRVEGKEVQFTEVPGAWFRVLIRQHLKPTERLALFSTCQSLKATVVENCTRLKLRLQLGGQQSKVGLKAALQLAAHCSNVHLAVQAHLPPRGAGISMDVPAVWSCITELLLTNVLLNSQTVTGLNLNQLTQLHTIQLDISKAVYCRHDLLYVAAWQSLLQAGGLPALRHLHCCSGMTHGDVREVLTQLGPVLGHKVTKLTLEHKHWRALTALCKWPMLQSVQVRPGQGADYDAWSIAMSEYEDSDTTVAMQQLFRQGLREVSYPPC